ncbi:hypothetical protein P8452_54453 [Trifolium repens]|nr:hypothetical protein P8452_54453 [Trifolium repens]
MFFDFITYHYIHHLLKDRNYHTLWRILRIQTRDVLNCKRRKNAEFFFFTGAEEKPCGCNFNYFIKRCSRHS